MFFACPPTYMQRLTVFSPATSRKYDDKERKRDLKHVMQMTGIERQHTVFFLEDHHMVKSEFLESINSLLSCGDVPGIWTPDELESLLAPLKEEWAASQGRGAVQARTPFEYFVLQVRSHMRIVLSMDATHPHFSRSAPRTQLSSVVATSCGWTIGARRACTSWSSGSRPTCQIARRINSRSSSRGSTSRNLCMEPRQKTSSHCCRHARLSTR